MANTYPVLNSTEQAVTITNEGQTMRGMLHLPTTPGPHPAVLLLHGFTGDKTGPHRLFVHATRALAAAGIAALRFDMRGSGESEGEFQDVTIATELSDAQAALDWLTARPEVDPQRVGLLGLSLGGLLASILAGRNASRIQGLAYWSAAANAEVFMHTANRTAEKSGVSTGSLMDQLLTQGYIMVWSYPVGLQMIQTFFQQEPLDELRPYSGKAIIIHNTSDPTVPASQASVYAKHFDSRATVHLLDDNTHTFDTPPIERQAIQLTVEWFANLYDENARNETTSQAHA